MDEAVELGKALSASFSQCLLFSLLPQQHGSIHNTSTVVAHRRLLEDKLMARPGVYI